MNKVDQILKEQKAVRIRSKRHEVWKFPNGLMFFRSVSPSDIHAENQQLRDLSKLLGIDTNGKSKRKAKEYRPRHQKQDLPYTGKSVNPLADKLKACGLTDESLKEKLADSEKQNQVLRELLDDVLAENEQDCECCEIWVETAQKFEKKYFELKEKNCFWCRIKSWFRGEKL